MKNSFKTYICITLFSITLWTCGSKDDTKEVILRPVKFDIVKEKIRAFEGCTFLELYQDKNNKNITLNVAFNYGSRAEITDAVKKIAQDIINKKIKISDMRWIYKNVDDGLSTLASQESQGNQTSKSLPAFHLIISMIP